MALLFESLAHLAAASAATLLLVSSSSACCAASLPSRPCSSVASRAAIRHWQAVRRTAACCASRLSFASACTCVRWYVHTLHEPVGCGVVAVRQEQHASTVGPLTGRHGHTAAPCNTRTCLAQLGLQEPLVLLCEFQALLRRQERVCDASQLHSKIVHSIMYNLRLRAVALLQAAVPIWQGQSRTAFIQK